jgi:hypothetical protein
MERSDFGSVSIFAFGLVWVAVRFGRVGFPDRLLLLCPVQGFGSDHRWLEAEQLVDWSNRAQLNHHGA